MKIIHEPNVLIEDGKYTPRIRPYWEKIQNACLNQKPQQAVSFKNYCNILPPVSDTTFWRCVKKKLPNNDITEIKTALARERLDEKNYMRSGQALRDSAEKMVKRMERRNMPKVRVLILGADSDDTTLSYSIQHMKLLHLTQPTVDRLLNKSKDTLALQSISVNNSTLTLTTNADTNESAPNQPKQNVPVSKAV